ncbi:MAG: TldD/PmbA family protein [candidate division Zixibacteria bacterium HGW-Zixibacteria-1]|nr:MAG: TldD/PmbA family protein [candidate division Zixibacteria bacterium HGW-Zixibacteria-1]
MNKKERLELAHWAIDRAKKAGANDAAVDIAYSRDIEVSYRDHELEELKESTQNSLNLEIYAAGRYSSSTTNDMRKTELERFIDGSVAMTKLLGEDPSRGLPDPKYYQGQQEIDLKIYDSAYDNITSSDRVEMARRIDESVGGLADNLITSTSQYADTYSEFIKVNSNGFEGFSRETAFSGGLEVTLQDENGGRPSDWDWATVRFIKDIPGPGELSKKAVERAGQKLGQKKMESGLYDMVVENRAASRLIGSLDYPMSGSALYRKNSFLEGKLGERIASEKTTITDDPFLISGLGSKLFDNEGMATRRRIIIDKGILKSYFISNYYGRKLAMEPTISGRTNSIIELGDKSLAELIKDVQKGIFVTSFIGGNSNSTTGDYSMGIIGMYIEDGKIIRPVNEMNISGNLLDLFQQLDATGNDAYPYSSIRRPSLYFKDIQFSGL